MARLQALLDDPSLTLGVHVPPATGTAGEVVFDAVRSADLAADRPWLAPGDLRWTEAGYRRSRPRPDPLFAPAPAVLVYALTPQRRDVPPALLMRATELGTALLSLPPSVGVARLEASALRLLAAEADVAARGAGSVQRFLLRALDSPKPERDLLERVHRLTGESSVLVAPWGTVLARAGDLPWRPDAQPATELPEGRMRLAGTEAWVLRVTAAGRVRSVLLASARREQSLPLLELTRTLLAVTALSREAEARGEQARRAALLAEWLARPRAAAELASRLAAAGLVAGNPYTVAVAQLGAPPGARRSRLERGPTLDALRAAGDELFQSLGDGALSEVRSEQGLWVFRSGAAGPQGEALRRALEAAAPQTLLRLGLSRPHHDPTGVADAYRQAVLALQSLPGPEGTARFETFDPVSWVLTQQPEENLRAFRDGLVGTLISADDGRLWRTLVAYLASPDDLRTLARELHIHPNTLRYRLKRIESLVGQPLRRPDTLARLHLAVQVDAALARSEP
ncbi:MAG: helix-turn-helix domain-containing protein [Deinococcales bacterium]